MAVVWLATDERLGRPVAVKILSDTLTADAEYLGRFRREARVAAGVQHPNLVPVYDFDAGERPYLVMEYIEGGDLATRLDRGDAPGADQVASELLAALRHIHAAGVLHRDIKPQNVLIDHHGHARLTDFGIAQPLDAASLTRTGQVIGTEAFIAPEVMAGDPASERSDLYALGVAARRPRPRGRRRSAVVAHRPDARARPRTAPRVGCRGARGARARRAGHAAGRGNPAASTSGPTAFPPTAETARAPSSPARPGTRAAARRRWLRVLGISPRWRFAALVAISCSAEATIRARGRFEGRRRLREAGGLEAAGRRSGPRADPTPIPAARGLPTTHRRARDHGYARAAEPPRHRRRRAQRPGLRAPRRGPVRAGDPDPRARGRPAARLRRRADLQLRALQPRHRLRRRGPLRRGDPGAPGADELRGPARHRAGEARRGPRRRGRDRAESKPPKEPKEPKPGKPSPRASSGGVPPGHADDE